MATDEQGGGGTDWLEWGIKLLPVALSAADFFFGSGKEGREQMSADQAMSRKLAGGAVDTYQGALEGAQRRYGLNAPLRNAFRTGAMKFGDTPNPFSRGNMFEPFMENLKQERFSPGPDRKQKEDPREGGGGGPERRRGRGDDPDSGGNRGGNPNLPDLPPSPPDPPVTGQMPFTPTGQVPGQQGGSPFAALLGGGAGAAAQGQMSGALRGGRSPGTFRGGSAQNRQSPNSGAPPQELQQALRQLIPQMQQAGGMRRV